MLGDMVPTLINNQHKMNKEIQNRREFFKNAAKRVLPLMGFLSLTIPPVFAFNSVFACDCAHNCRGDCENTCKGGCEYECAYGCFKSCKGDCHGSCHGTCKTTCEDACNESCKGYIK